MALAYVQVAETNRYTKTKFSLPTPTLTSSKPYVTPPPIDLMFSSGFYEHLHRNDMHAHIHIHTTHLHMYAHTCMHTYPKFFS